MRLSEFLRPDCILVPLSSTDKASALTELSELLAARHNLQDVGALTQAVLERERKMTTGLGHGIAVPHARIPGIGELKLVIGIARPGLDYSAIDRKPVELLILCVTPPDQPALHIQALGRISRMLTDESLRSSIKAAPDAAAVHAIITQYDLASG